MSAEAEAALAVHAVLFDMGDLTRVAASDLGDGTRLRWPAI